MNPADLALSEAAGLIAARRLSPVELLDACLSRIAERNPALDAVLPPMPGAAVLAEEAKVAARSAETEIVREGPRSPLHGIPVGIKDVIDLAGQPTTCHSKLRLDHRASADAACAARLRATGALFPAKLATHEFAIGGPAFDLPFPPARNPWNRAHHPGGSSSGSGSAVAARMLPAALGTDTGGSVRHPASHCGLVGLKPSYELVPRAGVFPLAFSLDHVGTLTRTVRDAALLLEALVPGRRFADGLHGGARGLRIGFVRHFHERDTPATEEVGAALEAAAEAFSAEGASVTTAELPPLGQFAAVNRTLLYAEAATVHGTWLRERPGDYAAVTRRRLLPAMFVSGEDYVLALRHRTGLVAAIEEAFGRFDLLLTASSMDPPARIEDTEEVERTYPRQARTPFNVSGHPALTLMAGLSAGGLPLSIQPVAPMHEEGLLLRAAHAFERAQPWPGMAPPL